MIKGIILRDTQLFFVLTVDHFGTLLKISKLNVTEYKNMFPGHRGETTLKIFI